MTSSFFPYCIIDGEIYFPSVKENIKDSYYCKNGETFYALVPNYTPIPTSMSVICAEKRNGKTVDIRFERDPNMVNLENSVSFITWSRKVPYTVPLYFYRYGNNSEFVYASFEKKDEEKEETLPVVYVLRDISSLKFSCYQDYRCIPSKEGEFNTILECIASCNRNPPKNIFTSENTHSIEKNRFISISKKVPFWVSLIILTILVVSLLYLYFKNRK